MPEYGAKAINMSFGTPAAQLFYDENAPEGVSVITYNWKGGNSNSGKIIQESFENNKLGAYSYTENTKGLYEDKNYPVDVKYMTSFYWDHEFVGESLGGGALSEDFGKFCGYIEGWGYSEFEYSSIAGLTIGVGFGGSRLEGKFEGQGFPSYESIAGIGDAKELSFWILSGGTWHSYDAGIMSDESGNPLVNAPLTEKYTLFLKDITGRIIFKELIQFQYNNNLELNIENYPSGQYLLVLMNDTHLFNEKILINK